MITTSSLEALENNNQETILVHGAEERALPERRVEIVREISPASVEEVKTINEDKVKSVDLTPEYKFQMDLGLLNTLRKNWTPEMIRYALSIRPASLNPDSRFRYRVVDAFGRALGRVSIPQPDKLKAALEIGRPLE